MYVECISFFVCLNINGYTDCIVFCACVRKHIVVLVLLLLCICVTLILFIYKVKSIDS